MTVNNAERRSVQSESTAVDSKDVADVDDWDPDSELSPFSKAVIATAVGLGLLIAAFAVIGKLAGWANDYGTILVYLAFFLWMSISGRLFWWGADKLIALLRTKKSDNRGAHR
ncbi:hypothetical protein ACIQYW_24580 [Rhodococcus erythropolis]|jgi:hypothetical protein|uniref:hypothetical protein n=2 Tax=Actinomycetota TaxID=201174 RepID=UPI0026187CAF|nr:hypothetical protein [uncultured Rhodococcus sp.]